MAITTQAQLDAAMVRAQRKLMVKTGSVTVNGRRGSHWLRSGTPLGTIPNAPAVCDASLAGALPLVWPGDGRGLYLAEITAHMPPSFGGVIHGLYDRLAQSATLTSTANQVQTVGVDVSGATANLAARRGAANFADVEWFVEIIGQTTNAPPITITYTTGDGVAGQSLTMSIPSAAGVGNVFPITALNGEPIRSIETFTVTSTNISGTYAVIATRAITSGLAHAAVASPRSPSPQPVAGWEALCLPQIAEQACVFGVSFASVSVGPFAALFSFVEG